MMIRSMPPASAHLADSPVPAPPPMTGRPPAACARRRVRMSSRIMTGRARCDARLRRALVRPSGRRRLAAKPSGAEGSRLLLGVAGQLHHAGVVAGEGVVQGAVIRLVAGGGRRELQALL